MTTVSIFIDESGDLGFNFIKNSTKPYFVIGALVCHTDNAYIGMKKAVENTIKNKIRKNSIKTQKINELKGSKTIFKIKKYFLNEFQLTSNWSLYFFILNKTLVDNELWKTEGKIRLYNLLAKELVNKIQLNNHDKIINLYIDKHKNRKEEKIFNQYIEAHFATKLSKLSKLNCYHLDSASTKGIQAIDMFLWGIFEKYNYNRTEWYDLFKHHIDFEEIFRQ